MKTRNILQSALLTAIAALQLSAPARAESTPAAVFGQYVTAANAGDMNAITRLISSQVARSDYVGCKPDMDNKTCLLDYIHTTVVAAHGQLTVLSTRQEGNTIHALLELRSDTARHFGQERIKGTDIVTVEQGLITNFHFVPDFADDQTADFFGQLGIGPRAASKP